MDITEKKTIAILGLGLMGASLAAALKQTGRWIIIGMDPLSEAREASTKAGYLHDVTSNFIDAVAQADVVILASPVNIIIETIEKMGPYLKSGAIVIDLGSTKEAINNAMEALPETVSSIGGHPMTGKKTSSVEGADAELYRERVFVLVPNLRTTAEARKVGEQIVEDIGAELVVLKPQHHDQVVAMISHLPHFLALPVLFATEAADDPYVWQLAAGGFRGVTEHAIDNPDMWSDIASTNGKNIASALRQVAKQAEYLAQAMESEDTIRLRSLIDKAVDLRNSHFPDFKESFDADRKSLVSSYGALGAEGSWSHAAAFEFYPDATRIGKTSFDALAAGCASGEYDIAVFPIHNTSTGHIPAVSEILDKYELIRVYEKVIPIHHCLSAAKNAGDVDPSRPINIYSHPQGFLQCEKYLKTYFPEANLIAETDTASGVKRVACSESSNDFAIGSAFAAELYGAKIIQHAVNDAPNNETRFVFCKNANSHNET